MARKNDLTDLMPMLLVMGDSRLLRGKTFSVTGHLSVTREKFVQLIEHLGGSFEKTPGWNCYMVTNNDWTAETAQKGKSLKLLKAKQKGCPVISEQDFYDMISKEEERLNQKKV